MTALKVNIFFSTAFFYEIQFAGLGQINITKATLKQELH